MAFCTSCGGTLEGNAQFCVRCGAKQAGSSGAATSPRPAPAPSGSNVVKILLIVVAGVVLLGFLGTLATVIVLHRAVKHSKVFVSDNGDESHVVTPFGTVDTSKDASKIAAKLNVDIYPGAKAVHGGSDVQVMGMHVTTGIFETSDAPDKVAQFYRDQMPKAMYTESNGEYSIISGSHDKRSGMTTVHIKAEDGATRITIVSNSGTAAGSSQGPS